ncbi:MAG TPA: hypothetical protein VIW80_06000 [Pyrinomonadaceae bacterium]|jgi:hypothetical protein
MTLTHLLRKAAGHHALAISHLVLEETDFTVPTNNSPTLKQLREQIEKLEAGLKVEISKLETEVKAEIGKLETDVKTLGKELEDNTATERAVTSKPFKWLLGVVAAFLVGTVGFFYTQLLPDRIEMGIAHSPGLTKRLDGFDSRFGALDGVLQQIRNEIVDLRVNIKGLADVKFISAALKEAVSGDKSTLSQRLPDVKRLVHQVISLNVPLPDKVYKENSKPLLSHYNNSKPPLKDQIWEVLVELANARSSTAAIVHPISEEEIVSARARGVYIENADVDLSQKENWENVIFKSCEIGISKPENDLVLTGVRFIECTFQPEPENASMQKLLETVLKSEGPKISEPIARFRVLSPVYQGGAKPQEPSSKK